MCCEQGNKGFVSNEELGAGGRRKSRRVEGFDPDRDFSTGKSEFNRSAALSQNSKLKIYKSSFSQFCHFSGWFEANYTFLMQKSVQNHPKEAAHRLKLIAFLDFPGDSLSESGDNLVDNLALVMTISILQASFFFFWVISYDAFWMTHKWSLIKWRAFPVEKASELVKWVELRLLAELQKMAECQIQLRDLVESRLVKGLNKILLILMLR